jgi:hypothetical protein
MKVTLNAMEVCLNIINMFKFESSNFLMIGVTVYVLD